MDFSNILNKVGGGNLDSILSSFNPGKHDAVPDSQVHDTYGQVATQLPQDQYVQSAREAFERLSPEQREDLARQLQTQAPQHGVTTPATQNVSPDPDSLATAVGDVHAQQGGPPWDHRDGGAAPDGQPPLRQPSIETEESPATAGLSSYVPFLDLLEHRVDVRVRE
jgi:hypothetical protein